MAKLPKIFVLDTNVLLHDYKSIYNFQENDIVLPMTVLEELDKFKKGNGEINYYAREFVRELDKLSGDKLFNGGVSLGKGLGKLQITLWNKESEDTLKEMFYEDTPDHRILVVAKDVKEANPDRIVVLVSKDVNLRIKARSINISAQDYLNDKVQNIDELSKGAELLEVSDEQVAALYQRHEGLDVKELKVKPYANQYFVVKGAASSALAIYDQASNHLKHIGKQKIFGIEARNSEQTFAIDALMRPEIQLVSLTGIAGTGKTLLALAAALAQEENFDQILLARPVIPLQNQNLGFLPGDINDKIAPFMLPLFDNLAFIKSRFRSSQHEYIRIDELQKSEKLQITPLAYIRGRSLSNVFLIIDEAQNLTPHEIKTIITRAGEGTKMIFTGDIQQIDSPYLDMQSNGLTYLSDRMSGQDLFSHVNLVKGERSRLAEIAGNLL
jgi:PhoH-like ATPase